MIYVYIYILYLLTFTSLLLLPSHLVLPSLSCWFPSFPSNSPSSAFISYIHIFKSRFHTLDETYTICLSSITFLFHSFLQIVILLPFIPPNSHPSTFMVCMLLYISLDSAYRENMLLIFESGLFCLTWCPPPVHPLSCKSHNYIYYGWVNCVTYFPIDLLMVSFISC